MQISREKPFLPHSVSLGSKENWGFGVFEDGLTHQERKGRYHVEPGNIGHMLLVNARHRGEGGRQRNKQSPMTPSSPIPTATMTPVASEGLKK